ncbi:hypothetical protein MesoLj113a_19180 [Mesorhizobium sp. 113-1-2]|nr:hypothetical protein MesoLj113a_19180 [Mesorhizobium sp. 113-1-2]
MFVPVTPELPQVGTVTSGLVTGSAKSGVGMLIIGLTPKLLSSEDPSGIPTGVPRPVDDVPDDVPVVVDSIDVVPEGDALDAIVLQVPNAVEGIGFTDVPLMVVVPSTPPPSKVESAEVVPATSEGDARTPGARTLVHPELLVPMEPDVVGEPGVVKPPGSSSTAPRGIPTGLRGEPTAERGEVIPVAGVLTCARLGPLNSRAITIAIGKNGIATSLSFRIGTTVVSCVQVRHA